MSFLNDVKERCEQKGLTLQQGSRRMLKGRTAVIVEGQFLVAMDMQATLEDLSSPKVLIAQDPTHLAELAIPFSEIGLAIIEIERNLAPSIRLVGELSRQGIPVIGITADPEMQRNVNWFKGVPLLAKPTPSEHIVSAIRTVLSS